MPYEHFRRVQGGAKVGFRTFGDSFKKEPALQAD